MGTDIEAYRAAVGTFYSITHRRVGFPKCKVTDFRLIAYCTITLFILLFLRNFVNNDKYFAYKVIILLACMDIETNPGPTTCTTGIRALDIFQLNTRSIRNKVEYLNTIADDYHILCFTETHLGVCYERKCVS